MSQNCPKCAAGLPPWLATFADLMSLLMCFFVLLLSFSEIDAIRFKKMAESMKDAFGVQRDIPAVEVVKGTSVIKQEFSPGKPQPTPIQEIRQQTTDVEKEFLDVEDAENRKESEQSEQQQESVPLDQAKAALQAQIEQEVEEQSDQLKKMLEQEILEGMLEVETEHSNHHSHPGKGLICFWSSDTQPRFLRGDLKDYRCDRKYPWKDHCGRSYGQYPYLQCPVPLQLGAFVRSRSDSSPCHVDKPRHGSGSHPGGRTRRFKPPGAQRQLGKSG